MTEYSIYYIREAGGKTHTAHFEAATEADALLFFADKYPGCEVIMCVPTGICETL